MLISTYIHNPKRRGGLMFCRKRDKTLVDLSKGKNRSCAPSKCGGWKWTYPSCLPGGSVCSGISGAWLPAVEVCRLYVWGPSRVASKKVVRGGASGSSSSSAPALMSSSSSSIVSSESSSSSSVRGSSSSSVRGSSSSSVSSGSSSSSSHHSSSSYSSVESSSSSHHSSSSYSSVGSSSSSFDLPEYQYESSSGSGLSEVESSSSSSNNQEPLFFIVQHPQDSSTTAGAFAHPLFSVLASFFEGVSYAWQWSLDGGSTWHDINPDGGVFFQANTDVLGINPGITDTSSTWNGSKFRAKITYNGETLHSDSATLSVLAAAPVVVSSSSASEPEASFYISQNPEDFSAAAGAFEAVLFSVSVVAPSSVSYAWQWSLDSGNTWYDINPNGGVFFQADTDAIGIYPGMTDTSSTWNGSRFRAKVTCDGIVILSEVATLTVNS